jgi:eukaryotic-like serine/threonine-protein kinase
VEIQDTGGNVREWCLNEAKGNRNILGGACDTPQYFREWSEVRDPFDRSPGNGFRCVKHAAGYAPPEHFAGPIERPFRDHTKERLVSDETFRVFQSIYAREARPLNPAVVSRDTDSEHWTKLEVACDAGYGAERIPAYLFPPRRAAPPYQAVLFFPGAEAILQRNSKILEGLPLGVPPPYEFTIKSGRALLYPVYHGTFERQAGVVIAEHNREQVTIWVREVSR